MTKASDKSDAAPAAVTADDIPATTAAPVGDDVQKIAIVGGTDQPIDQVKTAEQINIDREAQAARNAANPASAVDASGFVFIDDPATNQRYVAQRPEGPYSKDGTAVKQLQISPVSAHRPERGLQVFLDDETSIAVPENLDDWAALRHPDTGEAIFVSSEQAKSAKRRAA